MCIYEDIFPVRVYEQMIFFYRFDLILSKKRNLFDLIYKTSKNYLHNLSSNRFIMIAQIQWIPSP